MKKVVSIIIMAMLVLLISGLEAISAPPKEVRYGAIYPVTGPVSWMGSLQINSLKLVVDLVNNSYDIDSPGDIIRSEGLPNLDSAKVKLILGDSEGKPDVGRSAAERLISVEKVDVIQGCFQSGVTGPTSTVAERYSIPFLTSNSTSPSLTERGFKWFFRTTPHAKMFVGNMMIFLKELNDRRPDIAIEKIALVCEDTLWGQDTANIVRERAPELGFEIVVDIAYPHEATDVDAEVLRIKKANPDVIIMASYDPDAILFQKIYKKYAVNIPIFGNDTGHQAALFVKILGSDVNYVLTRDLWADSILKKNPMANKLNNMFIERFGEDYRLCDTEARVLIGALTMLSAINRAGSTDPEAIRQALLETDIPGNLLPLPWGGVKFNEKHQNIYGRGIINQWQDQKKIMVWPWKAAEAKVVWHLPPWSER